MADLCPLLAHLPNRQPTRPATSKAAPLQARWGRALALLFACWLAPTMRLPGALAQPAESLSGVGDLLTTATLPGGIEVAVYGPRPIRAAEPANLGVTLCGKQGTTISSGLVILACPTGEARLSDLPPSASYVPHGEWSPEDPEATPPMEDPELWHHLLLLSPEGLWAMDYVPMAPPTVGGTAGALLESVVFAAPWARPPAELCLRAEGRDSSRQQTPVTWDSTGVAFLSSEEKSPVARADGGEVQGGRGAHGVRVLFPVTFTRVEANATLWLALTVNGKPVTHQLAVPVAAATPIGPPPPATSQEPTLKTPAEGSVLGESLVVTGVARPGTLVVAWLEGITADTPPRHQAYPSQARLADQTGAFTITLAAPPRDPAQVFSYELHVRAEAPGYKSPEAIRKLR
jgi:hypothetical protein